MGDCVDGIDRDGDLDLTGGELDGYRDKKNAKDLNNQLEVAIGDGMEFTIHGEDEIVMCSRFFFRCNLTLKITHANGRSSVKSYNICRGLLLD